MRNDQMYPNRYLHWHEARKRLANVLRHLQAGGRIMIATYTKATIYDQRHGGMFQARKDGLYVQHGKRWDCLNFTMLHFVK